MSARKTDNGVEQVYAAAQQWAQCALESDGSLFTPGKPIWTPELLDVLQALFLNQPDEGKESTFPKLERQLDGAPPEAYQLMAEVLYFQYLVHHGIKGDTKRERVSRVLKWSGQEVTIPADLIAGLTPGIATVGASFSSGLPFYLGFIIEFVRQWKETSPSEQESRLSDPWAFKRFATNIKFHSELLRLPKNVAKTRVQYHAMLHLVHPDTFEGIVSDGYKATIAAADKLAHYATTSDDDVDRKIGQIRQALETKIRKNFQFWDGDIRALWDPSKALPNGDGPPPKPPPPPDLQSLADRLYLPVDFLQEIEQLLTEKRQVIFQGPPGTGKTYVARELARVLAGDDADNRVTLVQFHPSYAYEDFVQGFRPTLTAGQAGFELRDGPLLRAAERARRDEGGKHYLIIDEINRGNLAAVFGELYFLLEYRGENMQLQYSDAAFSLPKNLFIIGTMNTADRSIALVDLALRRRFYFVEFYPDKEPVKGVLRRWLRAMAPDMEGVADVVDDANAKLADYPHIAIGPSYFMREGLTEEGFERIWNHSIRPYLAEGLFNDPNRLAEFDLAKLRNPDAPAQPDGTSAE